MTVEPHAISRSSRRQKWAAKRHSLVNATLIVAMFYGTASAFFALDYNLKTVTLFLSVLAIVALRRDRVANVDPGPIVVLIVLVALTLLVPLLTSDPNMGPYIAIPLMLATGYLMSLLVSQREFRRIYVPIMTFFAIVSLVGTGIAQVIPGAVHALPMVSGQYVDYYNAYIHVYIEARGDGGGGILARNSGIAWEPGAYQVFLNLALFLHLHVVEERGSGWRGRDWFVFTVLIAAVLSTVSTAGIVVLVVVLVSFSRTILGGAPGRASGILSAVAVILVIGIVSWASGVWGEVGTKASREFGDSAATALSRVSLDRLEYIGTLPNWFLGSSFSAWEGLDLSLWNSILHTLVTLGFPFTVILLAVYAIYARGFGRHACALFAVLVICFSTETLFWRTFFVYLGFSGLICEEQSASDYELDRSGDR